MIKLWIYKVSCNYKTIYEQKWNIIQVMNDNDGIVYLWGKDVYFILSRECTDSFKFYNKTRRSCWGMYNRPVYFKLMKVLETPRRTHGLPEHDKYPDELLCQFGHTWNVINYYPEIGEEIKKLYENITT